METNLDIQHLEQSSLNLFSELLDGDSRKSLSRGLTRQSEREGLTDGEGRQVHIVFEGNFNATKVRSGRL